MSSPSYLDTVPASEQIFAPIYDDKMAYTARSSSNRYVNNDTMNCTSWSPLGAKSNKQQQTNFMDVLSSTEIDMSSLVDQSMWPLDQMNSQAQQQEQQQSNNSIDSLESSLNNLFAPWNSNVQVPPTIKEEPSLVGHLPLQQEPQTLFMPYQSQSQQFILPPTSPVNTSNSYIPHNNQSFTPAISTSFPITSKPMNNNEFSVYVNPFQQPSISREITPPSSTSASGSNSPNSSISTPPSMPYYLPHYLTTTNTSNTIPMMRTSSNKTASATTKGRGAIRRKSTESHSTPNRGPRRRASSHPSVASVVSLSAHEPVARIIDGIEYITFLYSHDRLVKEYTVRTDVENVNLDDIPATFRVQNAIYPRANVPREDYDGNRWEYETSCNKLGWELCWLNQDQLCGRRGLIQRAVDSYRNCHAEMRSRRVTRQEKVANGTLRKRRAKKAQYAIL
ncbi:MAG: hypothetical protein EXX96DRAFT_574799 [Benjaminiella poitrasii]|nr:MAG: hypothetical protein EXX96DRAFT_574799 [Benjaminiella poitrasii]